MLQAHHTIDPAVSIFHFSPHVALHFGMRQDQKYLALETSNCSLRDLFWRQDTVAGLGTGWKPLQQRRVHGLRTKNGYLDAVIPMSNRDIFCKADRSVFGCRINCASDLSEKTRSRDRVEQIPAAARLHPRYKMASGVDMAHHVNRPGTFPKLLRSGCRIFHLRRKAERDACIRTIKINRSKLDLGFLDQRSDLRFLRHIAQYCGTADASCHSFGRLQVNVRNDNLFCTGLMECLAEGASNAAARTGHDDGFSGEFNLMEQKAVSHYNSLEKDQRYDYSLQTQRSLGIDNIRKRLCGV